MTKKTSPGGYAGSQRKATQLLEVAVQGGDGRLVVMPVVGDVRLQAGNRIPSEKSNSCVK